MEFKNNVLDILNIISESNAARRQETRWGKEAYVLNKKEAPMKRRIINNDASKKLIAYWEKNSDFEDEKGDGTGKILLDPTPDMIGGHGAYAVWYSVHGKASMYADIKRIDGERWAFTELFLNEKGAKKLENNIRPINSDFCQGSETMSAGFNAYRRKMALKFKQKNPEELRKNVSKFRELDKEKDKVFANDWKKYEDLDNQQHDIDKKYNGKINFNSRNCSRESKKEKRDQQFELYRFDEIVKPLKPFLAYQNEIGKKAWELHRGHYEITKKYKEGASTKEIANAITKYKKEIDDFVKAHKDDYKFNY